LATNAGKADCLIDHYKDVLKETRNDILRYAYNQHYMRNVRENDKSNVGIGYDGLNLNYSQEDQVDDKIKNFLDINIFQSQQETLLVSQLTEADLKAYLGCLEANKQTHEQIITRISQDGMISPTFVLYISYRPDLDTRDIHVTLNSASPDVTIDGKRGKEGRNYVTKSVKARSDVFFNLARDPTRGTAFTITATFADAKTRDYPFYLPARPTFRIKKTTLFGNGIGYHTGAPGGGVTNAIWRLPPSCASIPTNIQGVIIPGTADAPLTNVDLTGGMIDMKQTDVQTATEVCISWRARYKVTSGPLAHMGADYMTHVDAFVAVPIAYPTERQLKRVELEQ
jgi:hypothetical protein